MRAPNRAELSRRAVDAGAVRQEAPSAASSAAPAAVSPLPAEGWQRWTHVRVADAQGRVQALDRSQAAALAPLLSGVVPAPGSAASDAALPAAVDWRLTLLQGGRALGTLELGGSGVRWHAAGAAPVFGAPPPEALQALRAWLAQA